MNLYSSRLTYPPTYPNIDHILERAAPHYATLKIVYPSYLHGRDLLGNVISVEIPGKLIGWVGEWVDG